MRISTPAALLLSGLTLAGCELLDATAGVEPPPAQGRGYPNLATVPRPPEIAPATARQAEVDMLLASRDASIREDRQVRAADPGQGLPPPRPRIPTAAAAPDTELNAVTTEPTGTAPRHEEGAEPGETAAPAPAPQAAAAMPRPQLPRSLFMGAVVVSGERGPLADFQRKVLEDTAAMAKRTGGRIRLVGGRSAEERQRVTDELVRLGVPAGRISSAAERSDAGRPAIELLVEN